MSEDLQYWIREGNFWGAATNHPPLPRPCQAEAAALPVICDVNNWRVEDQLNDYSTGGGGLTVDPMSCFNVSGFDLLQPAHGTWPDQDFSQFCGRTIGRSQSAIIQEEEEVNPKRYKLNQETTSAWSPNNFSEGISPSKESTIDDEFGRDRCPWNSPKIEPTCKSVLCNNPLGPSAAFLSSLQSADDHSNFITSANTSRERFGILSSFAEERRRRKAHGDSLCDMDDEYLLRRVRMETASPLPTFKVRKEKLGDRVTALQQLVSPFGKTDTASVLNEAVQYIELLHNQIRALSCPYLEHPDTHRQQPVGVRYKGSPQLDLRSRGLCLVPISSTTTMNSYEVAGNTTWPASVSEISN
ncbi:hypothetical protein MLD38_027497 [Melastoma candidum]|uniref:Uncharacterized protein n=1 Tax=Melastoma candidum TaxID=119954 RepID=A0ACB9P4W7_9MYRT|nr:hypothetical protein MLD38_027497 [Melastoma candidum]